MITTFWFQNTVISHCPPQPLATTSPLSVPTHLPVLDMSRQWDQTTCGFSWLLSLSINIFKIPFYDWIIFHCVNGPWFVWINVHQLIDIWVVFTFCQSWVTLLWVFIYTNRYFSSLGCRSRKGTAWLNGPSYVDLFEELPTFPTVAAIAPTPTSNVWWFHFLCILAHTYYLSNSCPVGIQEYYLIKGLICIFLMIMILSIFSCT